MTIAAFESKIIGQSMNAALYWVVELSHPSMAQDLLIVNNTADVTIGTDTYKAIPFEVTFDPDAEDGNAKPQIKLSNIDQRVSRFLRNLGSAATATLKIVASDAPDTTLAEWPGISCRGLVETREIISIRFDTHKLASYKFPPHSFSPDMFPGIFK